MDIVAATETAAHDVTGGIEAKIQVHIAYACICIMHKRDSAAILVHIAYSQCHEL